MSPARAVSGSCILNATGVCRGLKLVLRRIYTFDPTEDSTKHKTSKPSSSEDIIDVSYVLDPIRVVSQKRFEAEEGQAESTYFIRKAMNVKFDAGEGWYFDVDWQVVYEKAWASGNWELKTTTSKPKETPAKGRKKASKGKEVITKSAKKRQKVVKSLVEEVTGDLPKNKKALLDEDSRRSSRASSVETDMVSTYLLQRHRLDTENTACSRWMILTSNPAQTRMRKTLGQMQISGRKWAQMRRTKKKMTSISIYPRVQMTKYSKKTKKAIMKMTMFSDLAVQVHESEKQARKHRLVSERRRAGRVEEDQDMTMM